MRIPDPLQPRDIDGQVHEPVRRRMLGWLLAAGATPLLAACGGGGGGGGNNAPTPAGSGTAPWADDIQTFAANVQSAHPDPNGITRSDAWRNLIGQIVAGAGGKTDKANLVDCMRLAALMHDEHTRVNITSGFFAQAAIRFTDAADGYWVQQTTADATALLGAQILAIDGVPIATAKERIKAIIPAATAAAYANLTSLLLHQSELLWLAGIGAAETQTTYLLRDQAGIERPVTLQAGNAAPLVGIYGRAGGPTAPLWLSQPDRKYFMTSLVGSRSVYVRYAQCAVDPALPVDAFFNTIGQALAALPEPRVIFDLRNNGGGDSSILTNAIQQHVNNVPANLRPKVAVLVNGGVYSSATINLYDLRLLLGARTFGEPPGTAPNHTGELRSFVLPRTGTGHTSSSKVFTLDPALGANNYTPDVAVAPTIADHVDGRDPVLDRAELFLRTGN